MSTTTSLECRIKFDSHESMEEQEKIFSSIPEDLHDCMGTLANCFGIYTEYEKNILSFSVSVSGKPKPHDIINYFWRLIKKPEHVELLDIMVENLENGRYGILSASDSSRFTERWIPTVEVFDVIRRNPDNFGNIYSTLNDLLKSSK